MEARDLDDAIGLVNATGYGLTSGLESLDDREQEQWRERIRAGNLYINRPTTGAIVLRQPFGGMGKSSVGPGIKAGGPNYVVPLMTFDEVENTRRGAEGKTNAADASTTTPHLRELLAAMEAELSSNRISPTDLRPIIAAIESYTSWVAVEFNPTHDHFKLLGEDNFRRYLPVEPLRIRVHEADTLADVFCRAAAARAAGCRATVSSPPILTGPAAEAVDLLDRLTDSWAGAIEFVEEEDRQIADAIRIGLVARVRYAAPERVPATIRTASAEVLQYVADTPVSSHGRIEILWYLREQSISHIYHRYGNLGLRADELRDEPT
jgi:RHH-type proline utilization regulon transcriptional repressor/proline dehydrogenase/delta 1-pyrroline-5-carboxylate dehydrogenase